MRSPWEHVTALKERRSEAYWHVGRGAGGGGEGVARSGRRSRRVMWFKPEQKAVPGRRVVYEVQLEGITNLRDTGYISVLC